MITGREPVPDDTTLALWYTQEVSVGAVALCV